MTDKPVIRYEEAAHVVTMTGWACKTCGHFWNQDEHMARYCCATDFLCECGARFDKGRTLCQSCNDKKDAEKFAALPRVDWDGETPLVGFRNDNYFFDAELIELELEEGQADGLTLEKMQLVICEPGTPRQFDIDDLLCDDLADDDLASDRAGGKEVEKAVNDWIEAQRPLAWFASGKAASLESLRRHIEEPTAFASQPKE